MTMKNLQEVSYNIVLVEDDPIVRSGLAMMVESFGHNIIGEANNGIAAIDLTLEKKPDLIIMDINLPKLDGISAIEKINATKITPCIIITGYRQQEFAKNANKAGVFGYLQKPIDEYELKTMIGIAMGRFYESIQLRQEAEVAKKALEERKLIERAKGVLMDRYAYQEATAMKYLQRKSSEKNAKIADIARAILKEENLL